MRTPLTVRVRVVRAPTRSWKKSALIIGGSVAGGAGLGAVVGGGGGAKKGAAIGGVAGTIYDLATRNHGR
jgi:outer membrane lipoprotein SlyB